MFIGQERFDALHVENKPEDWREAQRRIFDRMRAEGADIGTMESYGTRNFSENGRPGKIPAGLYADHIVIKSSGNETSIYCHVYGNDEKRLAYFRVLDASAAGYAAAAACAGLFLELFNVYTGINGLY